MRPRAARHLFRWSVVLALASALHVASPAYAQKLRGKAGAKPNQTELEKKKKAKEIDQAYRNSLREIPNKPKADPWGGMR